MKEAMALLAEGREAVLATLEGDRPFTSAVSYYYEAAGSEARFGKIYILMSNLARHTKNIRRHPQASVMTIENIEAPVYEKKRVAAQGTLEEIRDKIQFENYKKKYLQRYPEATIFFTLPDFHFFEMNIEELYYVGGFGKIQSYSAKGGSASGGK